MPVHARRWYDGRPPHLLPRPAVIINFWTNHANANKPAVITPQARTARRFPGLIGLRRYTVNQLGKHAEGARLTKYAAMGSFLLGAWHAVSGIYTAGVKSPGCSWDGALPYLCLRLGSIRLCSIGPKSSVPIWVSLRQFSPFGRGNGKPIVRIGEIIELSQLRPSIDLWLTKRAES